MSPYPIQNWFRSFVVALGLLTRATSKLLPITGLNSRVLAFVYTSFNTYMCVDYDEKHGFVHLCWGNNLCLFKKYHVENTNIIPKVQILVYSVAPSDELSGHQLKTVVFRV